MECSGLQISTYNILSITSLQINVNELLWIVMTSVILTLFFDTPFSNIKKLLFKSPKRTSNNIKAEGVVEKTVEDKNKDLWVMMV